MSRVDADLAGLLWEFHPRGVSRVALQGGGIDPGDYESHYGTSPWRFRPYRQNGSRVWLRLQRPDGTDARYVNDHLLSGERIERRAYASDLRRGIYWRPVDPKEENT